MSLPPGSAVALPVLAVAVVFAAFCLVDLARADQVRYLPKWGWALVICVSVPWGGLVYLIIGKARTGSSIPAKAPVTTPGVTASRLLVPRRVPASPLVIEVDQLTKRFGPVTAVDGLSFVVRPGHVTGFLGPNGAGKTTTMRVILGLDAPTSGTALVGGRRYQGIIRPLHEVGSLLDATAVYGGRTAWFHLLSIAQSNGIGRRRVTEVLELTGLDAVAARRVREFSLGMKQRLGIAAALLADPPVLMFDEPVNGLDPEGIRWIRQLLKSMAAEGRTVLVSSHLMSEMALTADHLIIIGRGRLLADTPTGRFVSGTHQDVLVRSPRAGELAGLLTAGGAAVRLEDDGGLAVTGLDAPAIGDLAAGHGIAVHELVPRHASLEEAYLDLTSGSTEYHTGTRAPEGTAVPMTAPQIPATGRAAPSRLVRAGDVLTFEWTKLRSARSNYWTLLIAAVVTLGVTAIVAQGLAAAPVSGRGGPLDPLASSFLGYAEYTVLPVTVLSVLVFTSEYASGLIRTTFTAVPRRWALLAAKAAVTGAAALTAGELLAFACFFLTQAILASHHRGLSLSHPGAPGAVLAAGFALAVCALVGVGLGAVIRHTAGAIAAAVGLIYLLAVLCLVLPSPWNTRLGRFTLPFAAYQTVTLHPQAGLLSPGLSMLVLIAWPAAALLAAAAVITRRDV